MKIRDIPKLAPIPDIGAVLTLQDRSTSKTLTAMTIANAACDAGFVCDIFQNDKQTRLLPYGPATHIPVASSNQTLTSSTQDIDNHEPYLQCLKRNRDVRNHLSIYDTAAGSIARIPDILATLSIDDKLVKWGRSALVGIPISSRTDVCEAAMMTFDLATAALPNQYIVPVISFRDGNPNDLPRDHAFWQVVKKARHGAIILPVIVANVALALEGLQYRLSEIADPESEISEERLAAELCILEARAGMVVSSCRDIVLHMAKELEPVGFFETAGT